MSEYFTGITFPQQKVTPSDDAVIRRALLSDGILSGCDLSYAGSTLTMAPGLLIGCGRQFRHTAVQHWAITGATSGYARLVLTIDASLASTKNAFEQVVDSVEYADSLDGFLQLQRDDINDSGTVYQMVVCVVSLGPGGITGIQSKLKYAHSQPHLLWQNKSPTSTFTGQHIPLDLSGYTGIFVIYLAKTGSNGYVSSPFIPVSDGNRYTTFFASDSGLIFKRSCLADGDGGSANFGQGSQSGSTDDTLMIPIKIYGVK